MVKNGVAQAQEELRKEADNQIWQEGILRLDSDTCHRALFFVNVVPYIRGRWDHQGGGF